MSILEKSIIMQNNKYGTSATPGSRIHKNKALYNMAMAESLQNYPKIIVMQIMRSIGSIN